MRILLSLLILFFTTSAYADGFFGIPVGTDISALPLKDNQVEGDPSMYLVGVPEPIGYFDSYTAVGTKTTGVCAVGAQSISFKDDRAGRKILNYITTVIPDLETKLGKFYYVNQQESSDMNTLSLVIDFDLEKPISDMLQSSLGMLSTDVAAADGVQRANAYLYKEIDTTTFYLDILYDNFEGCSDVMGLSN